MKIGEAIKEGVRTQNAAMLRGTVDFLRAKGLRYADIFDMARRLTGIEAPEWETLMYRADTEDSA